MKCPGCGDNLIFDAKRQLLVCKSCDSTYRIKKKEKEEKSAERSYAQERSETGDGAVKMTKYTCASCGAELLGTYDSSALGFCSYCGGESILKTRMIGKRPSRIIPFSRTKADCHEMYKKLTRKVPFMPKELKDDAYIEEIRGIYVPYNIYETEHVGRVDARYSQTNGNTERVYSLKGNVESYVNIPVDGSRQLSDAIGTRIFPYDADAEEEFDEDYLATYYVELPDANDRQYLKAVKKETIDTEMEGLKKYSQDHSCTNENENEEKRVRVTGKQVVLSPAYFLTYRNKDRVCYTVLPGSGDEQAIYDASYAEIPVDTKKYMLVMALLSAAIFSFLSFMPFIPTFKHTMTMGIMSMMSAIALWLMSLTYNWQAEKSEDYGKEKEEAKGSRLVNGLITALTMVGFVMMFICITSGVFEASGLLIGFAGFIGCLGTKKRAPETDIRMAKAMMLLLAVMSAFTMASRFIFLTDEVVYILMTALLIPTVTCFVTLIKQFNRACSRPIPHFTRMGGHNEAKDI